MSMSMSMSYVYVYVLCLCLCLCPMSMSMSYVSVSVYVYVCMSSYVYVDVDVFVSQSDCTLGMKGTFFDKACYKGPPIYHFRYCIHVNSGLYDREDLLAETLQFWNLEFKSEKTRVRTFISTKGMGRRQTMLHFTSLIRHCYQISNRHHF